MSWKEKGRYVKKGEKAITRVIRHEEDCGQDHENESIEDFMVNSSGFVRRVSTEKLGIAIEDLACGRSRTTSLACVSGRVNLPNQRPGGLPPLTPHCLPAETSDQWPPFPNKQVQQTSAKPRRLSPRICWLTATSDSGSNKQVISGPTAGNRES